LVIACLERDRQPVSDFQDGMFNRQSPYVCMVSQIMTTIPTPWTNLLLAAGKPEILDAIAVIEQNLDEISRQSIILPAADHRYKALSINP